MINGHETEVPTDVDLCGTCGGSGSVYRGERGEKYESCPNCQPQQVTIAPADDTPDDSFQIMIAGKLAFKLGVDGKITPGPAFKPPDEMSVIFFRTIDAIYPVWLYNCIIGRLKSYKTGPISRACLRGIIRVPNNTADQIVDTILEQVVSDLQDELLQLQTSKQQSSIKP